MVEPSRSNPVKHLSNFVRTAPPFVGRRDELAGLENILQEVRAGQPQLVLLPGEAGIGKTRLLQELMSGALRRGLQVGYRRSDEDLTHPYLPFVQIFPAPLDQPALEIERPLSTNLQGRAELHYWSGLTLRISTCLTMRPGLIVAEKITSQKEEPP